jgi:hypothetical protein
MPRIARRGCGRVPARDVPAGDAAELVVEREIDMEYIDTLLWCALALTVGFVPVKLYAGYITRRDTEKKPKGK